MRKKAIEELSEQIEPDFYFVPLGGRVGCDREYVLAGDFSVIEKSQAGDIPLEDVPSLQTVGYFFRDTIALISQKELFRYQRYRTRLEATLRSIRQFGTGDAFEDQVATGFAWILAEGDLSLLEELFDSACRILSLCYSKDPRDEDDEDVFGQALEAMQAEQPFYWVAMGAGLVAACFEYEGKWRTLGRSSEPTGSGLKDSDRGSSK